MRVEGKKGDRPLFRPPGLAEMQTLEAAEKAPVPFFARPAKKRRVAIEDLPVPPRELSKKEMQRVAGGG